jgi:chromosome segregation ATPase
LNQATIKCCREEIENVRAETERIKSSAASNLASALKEIARWRAETDAKSKELSSALEFRNQQQERHERESAEKDVGLRMANLAVKTAWKELSQVQKQAEKKIRGSESAVTKLNAQMKAKGIEIGMLARSNTELETKAAIFEVEHITLKAELEVLRKEKQSFESEKARFLAFRTNPEAEKDRTEKAVEQAVQDAVQEAVATKDFKLQYLESQLDSFEQGRAVDQNTIRELFGDKYRLKEMVKDYELYQLGLEDRVSKLEQELLDWQQYFHSLTQLSEMKFLNPEATDWTP